MVSLKGLSYEVSLKRGVRSRLFPQKGKQISFNYSFGSFSFLQNYFWISVSISAAGHVTVIPVAVTSIVGALVFQRKEGSHVF